MLSTYQIAVMSFPKYLQSGEGTDSADTSPRPSLPNYTQEGAQSGDLPQSASTPASATGPKEIAPLPMPLHQPVPIRAIAPALSRFTDGAPVGNTSVREVPERCPEVSPQKLQSSYRKVVPRSLRNRKAQQSFPF